MFLPPHCWGQTSLIGLYTSALGKTDQKQIKNHNTHTHTHTHTHTSIRHAGTTKVTLNTTQRIFCHPDSNLKIEIILYLLYVLYGNSHPTQQTYFDGTWEKGRDECMNIRGGITRGLVKTA
jgi:hypothetical protein